MTKYFFIFPLLMLSCFISNAQSNNDPCDMRWSNVVTPLTTSTGNLMYQVQYPQNCGCGWPQVALGHSFPFPVKLAITLQGIKCDGTKGESGFSTGGNEVEGGYIHKENNQGNWHLFKQIIKTVSAEVRYTQNGDNYRFYFNENEGINTVQETINGLTVEEYNNRKKQQNKKDTIAGPSNNSSQGALPNHSAMNANDPHGSTETSNATGNATQGQTNISRTQTSNNDAIQNALAVNQAKITAMKSGTTSVRQVQQAQQQQQQQQNIDATAQAAGQLLGALLTSGSSDSGYEKWKRKQDIKDAKEREKRAIEYKKEFEKEVNNGTIPPEELVNKGVHASVEKDYTSAMTYFNKAASLGDIRGMCELADAFVTGEGVPKNTDVANKQLFKAFKLLQERMNTQKSVLPPMKSDTTHFPYPHGATIETLNELAISLSFGSSTKDSTAMLKMEFQCRSYLDSLYERHYRELSFVPAFTFFSSEYNLASLYIYKFKAVANRIDHLKQAVILCNKVEAMMDDYILNAHSNYDGNAYKANGYKSEMEATENYKNEALKRLQAMGVQ